MYLCVIRKLLFIYVLLHLPLLTSAETAYYVSDTETTWDVARSSCSLATPDLIYSDTGITAAINLSGLGVANGEQLWLGYFMAYQLFEYIGCVKLATIQSMSSVNFTTIPDPGQCYSACGNKRTIGMTFMTEATIGCFCLERPLISTIDRENGCDKSCIKNVEGPACGGDRLVSVYKTVSGIPVIKDAIVDNGDCVVYEPSNNESQWKNCTTSLTVFCQTETGEAKLYPVAPKYTHWIGSSIACFKSSLYPITYNHINAVATLETTAPLWTSMFRSLVVYKYNETHNPNQYGYLNVEGNSGLVLFTSDTTIKSLCQTGTGGTSTDSISTNFIQITTDANYMDLSSESSKNKKKDERENEPSDTKVSTYVGVAVGVMLLIIIIIVVVVVVKRKKMKEIKRRQRGNDDYGFEEETQHDVNLVYQNQPQNNEEPHTTKDESQAVYLIQLHDYDYIHPVEDMYDECKEADRNTNINVQPEHDDENEYFYPEQGPYEDLKHSDNETYSQLQTDTTNDYDDDSAYLYPAQGPYEDLKLSDSSTYNQLQMNDQPTNVTHT